MTVQNRDRLLIRFENASASAFPVACCGVSERTTITWYKYLTFRIRRRRTVACCRELQYTAHKDASQLIRPAVIKVALEKIEQKSYKRVLLALKIPGVKGLEILRAVREKRLQTMVVIIPGYASIETAQETGRLGAVAYLPKPFTQTEICNVTERAVKLTD